jgi:hypothetical protein
LSLGAGSAGATSTYAVNAITETGVLTIAGVGTGTTAATAGIGLNAATTSTIVLGGAAQTGAIDIADPASTAVSTINIGTNAQANVITIGSTSGAASLALKAGSGGVVVTGVLTATSPVFTTPALGVATGTSLVVTGALRSSTATVLASTGTVSVDPTLGQVFTINPASNTTVTYNAASAPVGAVIHLVITTTSTTADVITFGTNFKSTGTLSTGTTSGKVFTITFVGDGTNMNEVARTTAM